MYSHRLELFTEIPNYNFTLCITQQHRCALEAHASLREAKSSENASFFIDEYHYGEHNHYDGDDEEDAPTMMAMILKCMECMASMLTWKPCS